MRTCLFGFLFFFLFCGVSFAEEPSDTKPTIPSLEDRKGSLDGFDLALPQTPDSEMIDDQSRKKYNVALRDYFDYRISGYGHRLRLFEWQFLSSRIIFFVVLFLVLVGIYFAAVQFHSGLKKGPNAHSGDAAEATELVLSIKGLKVRSPVLGVIILTISLAFFYLYLVYVYPIENIF